jgi:hypothetical protein
VEQTQREFWKNLPAAKPDLVVMVTPISSPAIPAVILFGIPGQVDVWTVPWNADRAAFPRMAAKYRRLVFCPSGQEAVQAVERDLAPMVLVSSPRLFREYSCDVWSGRSGQAPSNR